MSIDTGNFNLFKRVNSFVNSEGNSLIHITVIDEAIELLEEAINNELDVNVKNYHGESPLHLAAAGGNLKIVKMLLDAYIWNINDKDYSGETPIFKAVRGGHLRVCRLLVNFGAHLSSNTDGKSLMQVALEEDNSEVVEYLLKQNLYDAKDYRMILGSSYKGILKKLVVQQELTSEKCEQLLYFSVEDKHFDVALALLDVDVNVNFCDEDEYTPLHLACGYGDVLLMSKLLEKTDKIDVQNNNGDTPLHCASSFGNLPLVELLVERGSQLEVSNNSGYTPLHLAVINGHEEVTNYLLECGVNKFAVDKMERISLDYALFKDYEDLVNILKGA